MKKLSIVILLFLPLSVMAQNDWEKPQAIDIQQNKEKKTLFESKKKAITKEDKKYLEGAIPLVDGKVTFNYDLDIPGKNAQQIYDLAYAVLDSMTKGDNQFAESSIALVNRKEHIIAARFKEWLIFQSSFLSLDRSIFNYTVIARCSNEHLNITLSRISYVYEKDRGMNDGIETTAENWIIDKYGLNKNKTKLSRMSGKFRKKTIDRKDEIFNTIKVNLLK